MKRTFIIAVLSVLFTSIATAQNLKDKVYFDEDWNVITNASKAAYYRLYDAKDHSDGLKPYKDYYISGKLQGEGFYSKVEKNNGIVTFVEEGEQKSYYENGKLKEHWFKKNGKINGEDISYYESGMIKMRMNYVGGKREGTATRYYDSIGTVNYVLNYKNGRLEGKQVQYDPEEGKYIWKEEFFNNGLMEKEITYSDDGNIRKVFTLLTQYQDCFTANETWYLKEEEDSLAGKITVDFLYDFDPDVWEYAFQLGYVEISNINGKITKKNGKYQQYDRQGRILEEKHYINGKPTGIHKIYNYKQNVYVVLDNDEKEYTAHYYTFDNQSFSGQWDSRCGNRSGDIGQCEKGLREGLWVGYDSKNRKDYECNYKNGKPHGKKVNYCYNDEDEGQLVFKWITNFVDGKRDGIMTENMLCDNGEWEVINFYNYKNGKQHGEFREIKDSIYYEGYFNDGYPDGEYEAFYWDNNGKKVIMEKGTFRNGRQIGEWRFTYPEDKIYQIYNYSDNSAPSQYYNLDGTPFTGKYNTEYLDDEDDYKSKTMTLIIKNSLVQEIQYLDSESGKVTSVKKFKKGLPIK